MKTLLVLTLLVALVGLGVWNSPKGEPSVLFFEAELNTDGPTEFQLGMDADGKPEMRNGSGDVIQWAEYTAGRVKTADEIAKNFSAYDCEAIHPFSPVCKRVDGVLTDLDLRALQHPGRGMEVDLSTPRAPTAATPMPSPVSAQSDYAGLIGQSPWIHALSRRDAERGLEGGR